MITTTHTGYICKQCDQPAPMGVGYPVHTQQAQQASESVSVCQCGQSVAPRPIRVVTRDEYSRKRKHGYAGTAKSLGDPSSWPATHWMMTNEGGKGVCLTPVNIAKKGAHNRSTGCYCPSDCGCQSEFKATVCGCKATA